MRSPWCRRREVREAQLEAEHLRAVEWQRRLYELTRPTGGWLDLGVITRERGWEIPSESVEILRRAGTWGI